MLRCGRVHSGVWGVRAVWLCVTGLLALALPELALAASQSTQSLGEIASGLRDDVNSTGSLILNLAYPVGAAILVYGVFCLYQNQKNQGNQGDLAKGITGCFVGAALFLLPFTINAIQTTLTGGDDSDADYFNSNANIFTYEAGTQSGNQQGGNQQGGNQQGGNP